MQPAAWTSSVASLASLAPSSVVHQVGPDASRTAWNRFRIPGATTGDSAKRSRISSLPRPPARATVMASASVATPENSMRLTVSLALEAIPGRL